MKCPDCDDGKVDVGEGVIKDCFFCNGLGELCDVCGDPVDDIGLNICEDCQADEEGKGDE